MTEDQGTSRGERRAQRRRKAREMRVSGKSFIVAVRNALLKRLRQGPGSKPKKRRR